MDKRLKGWFFVVIAVMFLLPLLSSCVVSEDDLWSEDIYLDDIYGDDGYFENLEVSGNVTVSGNITVSGNVTVSGLIEGIEVESHGERHVRGGGDEIDLMGLLTNDRVFPIVGNTWANFGTTGTGNTWHDALSLTVITGVNAGSTARRYQQFHNLELGTQALQRIPFDKDMVFVFTVSPSGNNAQIKRYVQVKIVNTEGQLASTGIGIEINNLQIIGESYSTGRSTTGVLYTMSVYDQIEVMIVHKPSVPVVEFYINSGSGFPAVATGSITTSANIPQSLTPLWGNDCIMISVNNNASAVDGWLIGSGFWYWVGD